MNRDWLHHTLAWIEPRLPGMILTGLASLSLVNSADADSSSPLAAVHSIPVGSSYSAELDAAIQKAWAYQPESGIWGSLDARYLAIEPPDRLVDEMMEALPWRDGQWWHFSGATLTTLGELLESTGIPFASLNEAGREGRLRVVADGVEFRPSAGLLESLSPTQRRVLYPYIGPFENWNPYHVPLATHPLGFRFMEAMSPSGLSSEMVHRVEGLCYKKDGNVSYFSDIGYCLRLSANDSERKRLLKTLGRQYSLCLQLSVSSDSDLQGLVNYWSGGGRNENVLPLLNSVAETSGVEMLDIIHLLPPLPRSLLHGYPRDEMSVGEDMPDCFSTAVSFFSDEAPARHLDKIQHVVDERYQRATKPWRFGDLLLMGDPDTGALTHACNYVAADIVFTKNGIDRFRPWILAKIEDVMFEYLENKRLTATFYRLKPEYQR